MNFPFEILCIPIVCISSGSQPIEWSTVVYESTFISTTYITFKFYFDKNFSTSSEKVSMSTFRLKSIHCTKQDFLKSSIHDPLWVQRRLSWVHFSLSEHFQASSRPWQHDFHSFWPNMSEMAQWFDGSVRKDFGRGNSRLWRHDHNNAIRSMHTSLRIGNVTSWSLQKGTHHLSFQRQMSLVHFSLNNMIDLLSLNIYTGKSKVLSKS